MKEKIITAILVIIVGIILLPLAKFNEKQDTQELKGISARDIQFIESIGFVSNNDGSWTLTISGLTTSGVFYYFDYKPITFKGKIDALRISTSSQVTVLMGELNDTYNGGTITLWGGDVS